MARELRIEYPGALYHVISRGNEGRAIYRSEEDREIFFRILRRTVIRYEFIIYAYCLMANHYHLLIETPKANLSRGMQYLNGVYAASFNVKNEHIGHLFQGRYKAILADKGEYLLELARYIVLNPVKAGIAENPSSYKWSSYLETLGGRAAPEFFDVNSLLSLFSENLIEAREAYKEFVEYGLHREPSFEIKAGIILGDDIFLSKIKNHAQHMKESKDIPKKQRFLSCPSLGELFDDIENVNIRNKQVFKAVTEFGYLQKEVADYLGLAYSTISVIMKNAEEESLS